MKEHDLKVMKQNNSMAIKALRKKMWIITSIYIFKGISVFLF